MIRFIFKYIEFFLLPIGLIALIGASVGLSQAVSGLPTITLPEQLEEHADKDVALESIIEDSGYTLTSGVSENTELYFYFGQMGESPVFLASSSALEETESQTTIIGTVTQISTNEDYQKLQKAVCEDLSIDQDGFTDVFSPYIINVSATGENAHSDHLTSSWGELFLSIGIIILAIVILFYKRRAKAKVLA